ncbi:MAG: IPTL-CTERM sorting domain-containing protein [Thermoanaerobaculia bacterium]
MKSNASHLKTFRTALLISAIASLLSVPAVWAGASVTPDSVTVATVNGAQFSTVDVPVYIRDLSGTPLGLDQPPGSRIQSYSIKVNYAPASAVQSITFTRAGITSSLTPTFENSPSSAGSISLLDTFNEATDLIPFTLDGAAPGNQVAHLQVTLAPTATPGTIITLTIDPTTLTQLTDQAGTPATVENTGNGRLIVVNGSITVVPVVPALSHIALMLLAIALGFVAIRFRS